MTPVQLFKCLADDTRLQCLLLIEVHEELCVCDLTDALQVSQPKISRHLAHLRKCDLVQTRKQDQWVYYRLNLQLPDWVFELLHHTRINNQEYLQDCIKRLKQNSKLTHC